MYSQNILDNLSKGKPDNIVLKNVKSPINFWAITEKDFNKIKSENNLELINKLSNIDEGLFVYKVGQFVLVKESGFYSMFKSIEDVKLINKSFDRQDNHNDPLQNFNFLNEKFLNLTNFENEVLKKKTGLNLDFSIDSLDLLDEYISNLSNQDDYVKENRLLLLAYLGNVIIKNNKSSFLWSIEKLDNEKHWEPKLMNQKKTQKIDITRWFVSYVYEQELRIAGLRGLFSVLTP